MYCTHFPCKDCAKAMIHAGVKKFIYLDDTRRNEVAYEPSVRLLCFAMEKEIATNEKYNSSKHKQLMVISECEIRKHCCQDHSDEEPTDNEDANLGVDLRWEQDETSSVTAPEHQSTTLRLDLDNAEM